MRVYVMSDVHGNSKAYFEMLQKIDLKDSDQLYLLGDVLDRGPAPITVLLDIMKRKNVTLLAGNHEVMALECLGFLMKEVSDKNIADMDFEVLGKLLDWQQNGGTTTIDELSKCDKKTKKEIINFLSDLDVYDEIEVSGRTYILVHAGLGNFEPDKELWEYDLDELVWERTDYRIQYFEDSFIVSGHTPTMSIEDNPRPGFIFQSHNNILIDCGCSFQKGRLGCLCLNDMQEYYVE